MSKPDHVSQNGDTQNADPAPASWGTVAARMASDRVFLVGAAILLVVAMGRPIMINALEIWLVKSPVPWPDPVQVNPETWQNIAFPKTLGQGDRYVMVEADGVLRREKDGIPDGDQPHEDDMLELLKIGGPTDIDRIDERRSNWYVSRTYDDTLVSGLGPLWQFAIEYYTGGHDPVPHVPEVCLVAGGATVADSGTIEVHYPDLPAPWNEPFAIRRVIFEVKQPRTRQVSTFVQYYVFSLNGRPEDSRNQVRLQLTDPRVRYAYFAKIQFGLRMSVNDVAIADERAREFLGVALPEALRMLPMPQDVERLNTSDETDE